MDFKKFHQWMALQREADQHSENGRAALEQIDGTDKVVNRHLLKIAKREIALEEFALTLAESPVYREMTGE